MEALAVLGEPENLVQAERMRIDHKWVKSRTRGDATAGATADDPAAPHVYRPRPLTSRWKPAVTPRPPSLRTPGSRPPPRTRGTKPLTRTRDTRPPNPADPAGPVAPAGPVDPAGPVEVTMPPEPEVTTLPPPWPGDLDAIIPPAGEPGAGEAETPLDGLWRLSRGHVRESVAVVLISLGAILPFPFWLVGALVAMFSRLWDARDKAASVGGPVLVVLVGSIVSALLTGGNANVVMIYTHALHADTGLWVRIGCVLTALYLSWRVYQGPRVKIPPWKR